MFFKKYLISLFFLFILLFSFSITVHADDAWGDDFGINYTENGTIEKGNAYGEEDTSQADVWNKIFGEYKGVIVGIMGIATLTMVVLFIFNFMKLGSTAGNPQARQTCLTGLLWTGLAAAGCGGVTFVVGFSNNLLK